MNIIVKSTIIREVDKSLELWEGGGAPYQDCFYQNVLIDPSLSLIGRHS